MDVLRPIIPYTTRPIRDREEEGREYYFRTVQEFEAEREAGRVIESRRYDTVYGPWYYYTMDDGQIDLSKSSYLIPGVLGSYLAIRDYFEKNDAGDRGSLSAREGSSIVIPLYIEVEDGERLERAIRREKKQQVPKYEEMCRRFLADSADMSEDKLIAAGITRRFDNTGSLDACLDEIRAYLAEFKVV